MKRRPVFVWIGIVGVLVAAGVPGAGWGTTVSFPEKDVQLQSRLERALDQRPYRELLRRKSLSVALVDLSDPARPRYSGLYDDLMRYAASLPKIAVLLTVFEEIEGGELAYTPELKMKLEKMIRRSSNRDATKMIEMVGFDSIAHTMQNPSYELYDPRRGGGLWVGKDYGGDLGRWKRDPLHSISHGATARQVARFFVMLDRGMLVSQWASTEMKTILARPAIKHKFVRGLAKRPGSVIYRKSGTWKKWHADGALVERDGKRYVAVALLESKSANGVLSSLILVLDDLIHQPSVLAQ